VLTESDSTNGRTALTPDRTRAAAGNPDPHRAIPMICVAVSPYSELARWVLDRLGVPYRQLRHAPGPNVLANRRYGAGNVSVVVRVPEATLADARPVLDYYEARSPLHMRLYPEDPVEAAEVHRLVTLFHDEFGIAVRAWAYGYMLQERKATAAVWRPGIPSIERLLVDHAYPLLARAVRRGLQLDEDTIERSIPDIEEGFAEVEKRLIDGRPFLMGDRLSAADIMFAVMATPAILPQQYGGPFPTLDDLPPEMRAEVENYRSRPGGQFALRVYQDHRPPSAEVGPARWHDLRHLRDELRAACIRHATSPRLLRPCFGWLRRHRPVLRLPRFVLVTRHSHVLEVLARDSEFTIAEVNARRMDLVNGPFVLGMDRSPQWERESDLLRRVVRQTDSALVQELIAGYTAELIDAVRPQGSIDVVGGLARLVEVRLVASYFGVPGPSEPTMLHWMRTLFDFAFVSDRPSAQRAAERSGHELRRHLEGLVAERKATRANGGRGADDVLGRLLALQEQAPWLDDDAVCRNLGGMIVGAVETTSKALVNALDELFRRPAALTGARQAAARDDRDEVAHYLLEALRFNPHNLALLRHSRTGTVVGAGTPHEEAVPGGRLVYAATLSAMFDPEIFEDPASFLVDRPRAQYLHFGSGIHACLGRWISETQLPEIATALLRLPELRPSPGRAGRIRYDGAFPEAWVLQFAPGN
jgi:cytochrome P450/glutathione S-transferase